MTCATCDGPLSGRQQRYCSKPCKIRGDRAARDRDKVNAYKRAKGRAAERIERCCETCGGTWLSRRPGARFCSYACRSALPQGLASCRWCDETFPLNYHRRHFCSRLCRRKADRARRRALEFEAHGEFTWAEFMRVARAFDFRCAYCSAEASVEPDHVVPLSRGGHNTVSNLLPACRQCNGDKSDRTLAEWAQWRTERGKPQVATSWSLSDARYWHLALGPARARAA